jgi:hypothetical protein
VRLDQSLADRILESVREHLPPEVQIDRRGRRVARIKARWERFSVSYGRSAAFAHVRRGDSAAQATEGCLRVVLDEVTRQLRSGDMHWPGLDYGPVEIRCHIEGDDVHAEIVDRHGTTITFPPVSTRM